MSVSDYCQDDTVTHPVVARVGFTGHTGSVYFGGPYGQVLTEWDPIGLAAGSDPTLLYATVVETGERLTFPITHTFPNVGTNYLDIHCGDKTKIVRFDPEYAADYHMMGGEEYDITGLVESPNLVRCAVANYLLPLGNVGPKIDLGRVNFGESLELFDAQGCRAYGELPDVSACTELSELTLVGRDTRTLRFQDESSALSADYSPRGIGMTSSDPTGWIETAMSLPKMAYLHVGPGYWDATPCPDFDAYLGENVFAVTMPNCGFYGSLRVPRSTRAQFAWLELPGNNISGEYPSDWGSFAGEMDVIDLSDNYLSGNFTFLPMSCSYYLRNNALSGAIPSPTHRVDALQLQGNNFTGSIPNCNQMRGPVNFSDNIGITGVHPGFTVGTNLVKFLAMNCSLTQSAIDQIVDAIWANRNSFAAPSYFSTGAPAQALASRTRYWMRALRLEGGNNAAPSGTWQASSNPSTPAEKLYELQHDTNGEGFEVWPIVTFNQ